MAHALLVLDRVVGSDNAVIPKTVPCQGVNVPDACVQDGDGHAVAGDALVVQAVGSNGLCEVCLRLVAAQSVDLPARGQKLSVVEADLDSEQARLHLFAEFELEGSVVALFDFAILPLSAPTFVDFHRRRWGVYFEEFLFIELDLPQPSRRCVPRHGYPFDPDIAFSVVGELPFHFLVVDIDAVSADNTKSRRGLHPSILAELDAFHRLERRHLWGGQQGAHPADDGERVGDLAAHRMHRGSRGLHVGCLDDYALRSEGHILVLDAVRRGGLVRSRTRRYSKERCDGNQAKEPVFHELLLASDNAIAVPRHETSLNHFMRISYGGIGEKIEAPFLFSPKKWQTIPKKWQI